MIAKYIEQNNMYLLLKFNKTTLKNSLGSQKEVC